MIHDLVIILRFSPTITTKKQNPTTHNSYFRQVKMRRQHPQNLLGLYLGYTQLSMPQYTKSWVLINSLTMK